MDEVLVSVEHADGVATIMRDRHGLWLNDEVGGGGSGIDGYRPAVMGLAGDRTLQGGRLPPGAVAAEVVDDADARHAATADNGAWIVVVDQALDRGEPLPVRFSDATGTVVTRPHPKGTAVEDASESCPACGSRGWELVDGEVACRTCGHAEQMGTFFGPGVGTKPMSRPPRHLTLVPPDFPVYAAVGRQAQLRGWGASSGRTNQVTLADEAVAVETGLADRAWLGDEALARSALEEVLQDPEDWPERSLPALSLWIRMRERGRRRAAALATAGDAELEVDGRPARFTIATSGDCWAAVRRDGGLVLTVTARGVAPADVRLAPLDDPAGALS